MDLDVELSPQKIQELATKYSLAWDPGLTTRHVSQAYKWDANFGKVPAQEPELELFVTVELEKVTSSF